MKELESMYDEIFKDKELQKLFLNFYTPKWNTLTQKEKINVMEKMNDRIANIYGYTPLKMIKEVDGKDGGFFNSYDWQINISPEVVESKSGYENIDVYFHELRHSLQYRFINNKLQEKEHVDPSYKEKWEKNYLPGNYFDAGSPFYLYEPIEADAWKTGLLCARSVYSICHDYYKSDDPEWERFCESHKDYIIKFISDNSKIKRDFQDKNKMIDEIYNKTESDKKQIKKSIKNMNINEVGVLLSPYVFNYLDTNQKVELLNKYEESIRVGRKINIKRTNDDLIKIDNECYKENDSLELVSKILSSEFNNIKDSIVNNKDINYKINENVKKEINLNLYKNKDNEQVNYISNLENQFAFLLQPITKYEYDYIFKELTKLKEIELKVYGKNCDSWKKVENTYNNAKIHKMVKQIMGCNFKDYYKSELKTYQERIKLDKQGKLKYDKENASQEIQSSIYDKLYVENKDKKEIQNNKKEAR